MGTLKKDKHGCITVNLDANDVANLEKLASYVLSHNLKLAIKNYVESKDVNQKIVDQIECSGVVIENIVVKFLPMEGK